MTAEGDDLMDEQRDVTIGELNRSVVRLETAVTALSVQMQGALGPVSEIKVRIGMAEQDINGLGIKIDAFDARVQDVKVQAARISGGIGLLAFIAAMVPWPWKH